MQSPSILPTLQRLAIGLVAGLGILLAACSTAAIEAAPTATPIVSPSAPSPTPAPPQAEPSAAPANSPAPAATASSATDGQLRLVLASDGNEARYRVREQLASLSFPSDAVGATSAISGTLVIEADGTVVRGESRFVIDLQALRSDSSLRDGFIQRNTLETSRFPTVEFVPTEALGLPSPLPASGEVTFQLVGELTLHGATRSTTWEVTARIEGQELIGSAATTFTFGDFNLTIPSVARVLSIEDHIQLEYDFHFVLDPAR